LQQITKQLSGAWLLKKREHGLETLLLQAAWNPKAQATSGILLPAAVSLEEPAMMDVT